MDEDTIQPQQPVPDTDQPSDAPPEGEREEGKGEQVFDITPDLNISPVKESEAFEAPGPLAPPPIIPPPSAPEPIAPELKLTAAPTPTPAPAQTPVMQAAAFTQKRPSAHGSLPVPPPHFNPQPSINQLVQPARQIPLQDFLGPLNRTQTGPANPPAKTIGGISAQLDQGGTTQQMNRPSPMRPLDNPNIKPLRTYETDVADILSRTHASKASIAIAETKKNVGEERIASREPSHAVKNLLLVLISLALIGGGGYGAYYLYTESAIAPQVPAISTSPSPHIAPALVASDLVSIMPVDGLGADAVIAAVQKEMDKPQPVGSIREIVPVVLMNGNETNVTGPEMLKQMAIPVPDILARSISDSWMLGSYENTIGRKTAFVIVTNDFFQNAFAGMLQWEEQMPSDLKPYLASIIAAPSTISASTTSSSTMPLAVDLGQGQYINKIIASKDVREYATPQGQVVFLYSFVDSRTLVFAGDEAALSEILTRLEKQAYLR